ncbi:MAG: hypothetical protein M3332_07205 [Actinomycetota bacterium]|nr:hypothetical protein [Actinomycetota bacterium]
MLSRVRRRNSGRHEGVDEVVTEVWMRTAQAHLATAVRSDQPPSWKYIGRLAPRQITGMTAGSAVITDTPADE